MNNSYKYPGQPLTAKIAQELIIELFTGQTARTRDIIATVDKAHRERNGEPARLRHHPVQQSLTSMKKSGLAENQRTGFWSVKRYSITTLDGFLQWASRFGSGDGPQKYLFRGVSNKKYDIEASAYRRIKKGRKEKQRQLGDFDKFLQINRNLIRNARFRGHDRKDGRKLEDLEVLAEFQHYGAATCLIDFTFNPLVALWFACKQTFDESSNSPIDGKLVAVPLRDLKSTRGTPEISEITLESLKNKIDDFFRDPTGTVGEKLYQWRPRHQNNRILAQQSIFLFGFLEIDTNRNNECIIDGNSKKKIREDLQQIYGITEDMLFPDFDGFASQYTQEVPYTEPVASQYRDRGYRAYQRDDYDTAFTNFEKALQLDPNDAYGYRLRGVMYNKLKRYGEATKDFDIAIRLDLNDSFNYYWRGLANNGLGQYEEAIDDFDNATRLNPQDAYSYYHRGLANNGLKRFEDAIKDFDVAIRFNPKDAYSHNHRGLANNGLGQYEEAIKDFDVAIMCAHNYRQAYYNLGVAKYNLDRFNEAREDLQTAQRQAVEAKDEYLLTAIEERINKIESHSNRDDPEHK